MRPQTAGPLNNLTKALVRKPQNFARDAPSRPSPDIPRRIKHQGNVQMILMHCWKFCLLTTTINTEAE